MHSEGGGKTVSTIANIVVAAVALLHVYFLALVLLS